MKDKELIWVSKELAEEYNQLESAKEQERAVKKIINDKRLDIEAEQELLSESLLQFKSVCLAHRKGLEKVYREQADTLNTLWEDMGDVTTQIDTSVNKLTGRISPLKQQVASLKKEIGGLNIYVPENLVKLASQVATMDDKTKILLHSLLDIEATTRTANKALEKTPKDGE